MSISLAGIRSPELRVKLPRVVDWTAPIWGPAIEGNADHARALFVRGEASPWDVNPIGGSVLHYAADHFNADLCRLLLDFGVDPSTEDDCKRVPVEMAWEHALSGNLSKENTLAVADVFKNTDYLVTRQFTVLHKVILGLISKDLRLELQCSTSEIDSQDSQGRTPLSWAAARGDIPSVQTLLEFGADSNLFDHQANSPLHYVKTVQCAQPLLHHGSNVSLRNCWGATAMHTLCRGSGDISILSLLLESGADPNARDSEKQTPLHEATFNSHTRCAERFITVGADINIRNASGDSLLRFAILFRAHDSLRYMLRSSKSKPDFGGVNSYGQTFAHSIARVATLQTVAVLFEERTDSLLLDVLSQDANGKTSVQYLEERLEHMNKSDSADGGKESLKEAFERLVVKLSHQEKDQEAEKEKSVVFDTSIDDKLSINIHATELNLDEERESDDFYDTIEAS